MTHTSALPESPSTGTLATLSIQSWIASVICGTTCSPYQLTLKVKFLKGKLLVGSIQSLYLTDSTRSTCFNTKPPALGLQIPKFQKYCTSSRITAPHKAAKKLLINTRKDKDGPSGNSYIPAQSFPNSLLFFLSLSLTAETINQLIFTIISHRDALLNAPNSFQLGLMRWSEMLII